MSSVNYINFPKVTINFPVDDFVKYAKISYKGITTSTNYTVNLPGKYYGTYTGGGGDLSFNTIYTFTITPYNSQDISGSKQTIIIDTTPKVAGNIATNSTASNTQLQWKWCGNSPFSYVNISKQVTTPYTTGYVDVSKNIRSTGPYYDLDLSGNTTYIYKITPYTAGDISYSDISNTVIYTSNVQAARDLSAIFVDTSAIRIQFTAPKNSYSSSYYYQLNAVYSGVTTSISGSSSPLLVNGLIDNTTYSCSILSYLDNVLGATSDMLNVKVGGIIITYSGATPVIYNTYTNYVFTSGATNTISFSKGLTFSLLAVGGGGGAGGNAGGGGGGGGVFQYSITTTQSDTLTISIGSGGAASTNGNNTTVTFTNSIFNLSKTITAAGGGAGGVNTALGNNGVSVSTGYGSGGSGGGTGRDPNTAGRKSGGSGSGVGVNGYGGGGVDKTGFSWVGGSGGGGAGAKGVDGSGNTVVTTNQKAGSGGVGVACTLPGIDNTYFWGGGGAGGIEASVGTPGAGGKGGGGGGSYYGAGGSKGSSNNTYPTVTDGSGGTNTNGGKGGTNSGGGGAGGNNNGGSGSPGGSGIVIIAVLTSSIY